ncbi:triosephosphate isomerase [Candidatus Roizmanbacteria bacterium]|nr:triosephosphate isomerase [Candidatus Roizmanbacteria bacterium]
MKLIVANWKSHKTDKEGVEWFQELETLLNTNPITLEKIRENQIRVVVCPPFPLLPLLHPLAQPLGIFLGAQNISSHEEGSFTGEVPTLIIADMCQYVIVGHSERRALFHETDADIGKKVTLALEQRIEPIVCVRNEEDIIPPHASIVAYEPVAAIGTGNNMRPEEVVAVKETLLLSQKALFLYGGSVDPENASSYLAHQQIDGLLIGSASLDPYQFYTILREA